MIVAVDFDGVLSDIKIQKLVLKLRRERNEIWVVTARRDNDYSRKVIEPILDKLGLSLGCVIYTDEKPKVKFIEGINADIYIDNISSEIDMINNYTKTIALLFTK